MCVHVARSSVQNVLVLVRDAMLGSVDHVSQDRSAVRLVICFRPCPGFCQKESFKEEPWKCDFGCPVLAQCLQEGQGVAESFQE